MSKLFVDSVLVQVQSATIEMTTDGIPYDIKNGTEINSILNVEKTKSLNGIDTYTIYLTNGNTFEYNVTNGGI